MQNCPKLFLATFWGRIGLALLSIPKQLHSKYLIFEPIKLTITGFKMMPKSRADLQSWVIAVWRWWKQCELQKKAVKPMLFYKTLYFLRFYYYVNEIRTAYDFISCHHMYGISENQMISSTIH